MSLVRRIARKHSSGSQQLQTQKIPKKTFNDSDLEDEFNKEVEDLPKILDKELLDLETVSKEKKKRKPREKKEPKEKVEETDPESIAKNLIKKRRYGKGVTCAEEIAKVMYDNGNKPVTVSEVYDLFGDRIKEVFPNAKNPKSCIHDYFYKNKRGWFVKHEDSRPASHSLNLYNYENRDDPELAIKQVRKKREKKVEEEEDDNEIPKRKKREVKKIVNETNSEDEPESDSDHEEIKATERKEEDEIEMIY